MVVPASYSARIARGTSELGTNGMVFMCTGIPEEKRQNELYFATQKLNAAFIRDKTTKTFDLRTTHLVVGSLAKTEKFLCALAAGIPLVGEDYIWESEKAGKWLEDKIQEFDIGNPQNHMRKNSKFFIPTLSERQAVKANGGAFREWHVVVLIEDKDGNRQQEIYRRLLEIGGAKVKRWTIKHLQNLLVENKERKSKLEEYINFDRGFSLKILDPNICSKVIEALKEIKELEKKKLPRGKKEQEKYKKALEELEGKNMPKEKKKEGKNKMEKKVMDGLAQHKEKLECDLKEGDITHIISHPNMLTNPINSEQGKQFAKFLAHNDRTAMVPVVAYIFVGDCLTKPVWPKTEIYDIRKDEIIQCCSRERKTEMLKGHLVDDSNGPVVRTYSQPIAGGLEDEDDGGMVFSQATPSLEDDGGVDYDNFESLPFQSNTDKVKEKYGVVKPSTQNTEKGKGKKQASEIVSTIDEDDEIEIVGERQSSRQKSVNILKAKAKVFIERQKMNSSQTTMDQFLSPRPGPSRSRIDPIDRIDPTPDVSDDEISIVENTAETSVHRRDKQPTRKKRKSTRPVIPDDLISPRSPSPNVVQIREEIDVVEPGPSDGEPSRKKRKSTRLPNPDDVISSRSPSPNVVQNREEIEIVEPEPSGGEPSRKKRKSTRLTNLDDLNSPRSPCPNVVQDIEKDKHTNNNNSFLGLKRSGSIKSVQISSSQSPVIVSKKSSRTSLSRQGSSNSGFSISRQCSVSLARLSILKRQDSFTEDVDESSNAIPVDDTPAGRLQYCNNMFSLRRSAVVGLDIGIGGRNLKNDIANEGEQNLEVEPLSAAMVNNIWTCLDDGGAASIQVNEGWMFALALIRSVVSRRRYPPMEVMYKVMNVALKDKRKEVRLSAYSTLLHVIQLYQPGPSNRRYYLHLMSSTVPDKSNWELGVKEPWEFLVTVVEGCIAANSQETSSVSESEIIPWEEKDQSVGQNGSWSLMLRLIVELLDTDLKNWFEDLLNTDVGIDMTGGNCPLVASVIWPAEIIEWSKRLEKLCTWYVSGVGGFLSEQDLESLRKMIGLAAQVIQMKERSREVTYHNINKNEMATCLARELNRITLASDDLWAELYLLEPAWLSALVSAELLAKQTNKTSVKVPTLRSIVDKYVNAQIDISELDPNRSVRSSSRKIASPRKPLVPRNIPGTPPSSKKIKVNVRNAFGETPLHKFCKKGDVARITECLSTPGVDINSRDNNGWSPLHEAVNAGSVAAVEQLINHNTNNLHKYFVCLSPKKVSSKVDLLAVGGEDKMNPFHEAVVNNNVEIVKLLFSVAGKSGFPSVQDLMSSQTGEGSAAVDLSVSTEMANFLKGSKQMEDNKSMGIKVVDAERFSTVLHLAMSKYIAANCLASVYGVLLARGDKKQNILDVNKVIKGDDKIHVQFNKWGIVKLSDGLKTSQFGVSPRFDIFREDIDKARDVRDYEKLLYPDKLEMMSTNHPVINQLKLLKISKQE